MEKIYNDFLNFLIKKKKVSSNTLQSYRHDVRQFLTFLQSASVRDIAKIDAVIIQKYLNALHGDKLSNATISRNLSSLRTFCKYLVSSKVITFDPTLGIKGAKVVHKLPDTMSSEEVELLLQQPNVFTFKGKRDKAMLEVLYATGMRASELIALNVSDVNLEVGYIITAQNTKKERFIPLYPIAINSLRDYLSFARENFLKKDFDTPALFLNIKGQPMTRQGFWKILKGYTKAAGIEKDITPKTLRHSFATHLLKNGADLNSLKDMLGHSTLSSTKVYTKVLKNQYMNVYENCHPRAKGTV